MSLEAEMLFTDLPRISNRRSKFKQPFGWKGTFDAGDLIPIYCKEVLPGDTFEVPESFVCRMTTPIFPVMDNAFLSTFYFFVPNRLLWEHWEEFCGENKTTKWEQQKVFQIPQLKVEDAALQNEGTVIDYFGLPTKTKMSVNALPFRAYALIWNEWFRDQNLQDPCMVHKDDTTRTSSIGGSMDDGAYITTGELGGLPLKAAKFHDYFTSCLPAPQKGPTVMMPIGSWAPVKTQENPYPMANASIYPMTFWDAPGGVVKGWDLDTNRYYMINGKGANRISSSHEATDEAHVPVPNNLWADLSQALGASIEQLRVASATQAFYERIARYGSRYRELLRGVFGVTPSDARMQIPEYLGGHRVPLVMDEVAQTSQSTNESPQGNLAAYSSTSNSEHIFTRSFSEHGFVIGLMCVRTHQTYQQGIEKFWSKKNFFDHYLPQFDHIGEQPVLNKEIFAQGNAEDDKVFGYQEAWAEYRYSMSHITGKMRSNAEGTLDSWHYASYYESLPHLDAKWIHETKANVARTIAVQNEPQFFADFYFDQTITRGMSIRSTPAQIL